MTEALKLDGESLKTQASRYFDRPSLSSPAFISDNTMVILDDRSGVPQVSRLVATTGEITAVTSFGERVLSLLGSLGGAVIFGMDTGGDERQQIWRLSTDSDSSLQITNRPDAMHEPGALSSDGSLVLIKSNARDEATFDIVALDLVSGTGDIWFQDAGTAAPLALSADKQRALVIRANTNLDADLWLIDRASGETRNLTAHNGEAWLSAAAFAPGEESVDYLSNDGGEFLRLVRQDLVSGGRRTLLEVPGHDVEAFRIAPNGRYLAVAINEHGWSRVELHSLVDRRVPIKLTELPRGTVDRFTWSPDSSKVAFGFSTAEDPSSIVIASATGEFMTISAERPDQRPPTATPELISFTTFDDLQIPGFLLKPDGEGPFPVLVEIHGGPESQRRLQYSSAIPTDQFIQSLGIAVLTLNVRGSTGYGKSYSHLDDKDLRLDSVRDVEAAVRWLRTRDDIIADRIAVMGQSYGGFMTLGSIAFNPDLWTAAVDVVGIANFVSFLERTGPWRRKHRSEEYGFLDHDRELLERISPLNHVDRITAPLFVIHGRNDPRVPLFEAEQIVAALEERGQEVHLRVFDDEGHGLSKRQNRIDGYAEAAGFLARHLLA